MPALYAEELIRMIHMQEKVGITSHMVVMAFSGPQRHAIPAEFLRIKRGLDLYWRTQVKRAPVIVVLMPFASPAAKDGFMQRVEGWLGERFGGTFESLGVHVRTIDFSREDPLMALSHVVRESK
jgi:hypothetical protein